MAIPVAVIALLVARMQYRKYGKLTPLGLALLCLMLFVPNLVFEYATRYEMPGTLLDYAGVRPALCRLLPQGAALFPAAENINLYFYF